MSIENSLPIVSSLTLADIEATQLLIGPHIQVTPVFDWQGRELAERLPAGTRVNLKLELFQHTGSFKARGALSVMLRLPPDVLARGVTAVSAGNHAIATAFAARRLGVSAKVVMMATANPARIESARQYGAEVLIAPDGKTAFELAERISSDEGRTFVHPFEGPHTALGTATLGLEWLRQAGRLDAVIVPIGGGGLCAGVASAVKLVQPDCKVYGVEPRGAPTMYESFRAGAPVSQCTVSTIADSLAPPFARPFSYALCRANVDEIVLVSDDEIRDAMRVLFKGMKLAVEPAGAAATAGLLGPLCSVLEGARVGLLICGANIDVRSFTKHIEPQ